MDKETHIATEIANEYANLNRINYALGVTQKNFLDITKNKNQYRYTKFLQYFDEFVETENHLRGLQRACFVIIHKLEKGE